MAVRSMLPLEIVAKLIDIILESVQLRISGANNGCVGELGCSCTARQNQGPLLLRAVLAALKVSACRGNFSGASASHSTAIAAQQHGVATIPASAYFLAQLLQENNTRGRQLKGLPSTFMEQLTQPFNLGQAQHIRKDYSAQHMWWCELGVPSQSNGPSPQLV